MSKHYFVAVEPDTLTKIYRQVILWFKDKEYEVEGTQTGDVYLIQAQKTSWLRTVFGTNLAFKVHIYWSNAPTTAGEFIIETRLGKWVRNIAGAGITALFTSGFTVFTGVAGASWALVLERDLINHLQTTLGLKRVSETHTPSAASDSIDTQATSQARSQAIQELRDEIDQLQAALSKEIISPEEFQTKKQKLEEKIDQREMELLIEDKTNQLQTAFENGILDADEYEAKLQSVETLVKEKLAKKQKLKEARDNGILTQAEYEAKLSQL